MPKIRYQEVKFRPASLIIIRRANTIIAEYEAQGFDLTLRQLFYQFVSRGWLGNTQPNYKNLGSIINDARLAGLIDWHRIEDRTRGVESPTVWGSPGAIISACASQFRIDKWAAQPCRVEVWIEKEALAGVFERVCRELQIPYLCCRGYTSQSEMWRAGRRLFDYAKKGQKPVILHFGDHDPSGIDMSRDIEDRLRTFLCQDWYNEMLDEEERPEVSNFGDILKCIYDHCGGRGLDFRRLALNMEQVREYNPPPNPTKMSDSRSDSYVNAYGEESWELDALNPTILADLVRQEVLGLRDETLWTTAMAEEEEHRRLLNTVSVRWDELTGSL